MKRIGIVVRGVQIFWQFCCKIYELYQSKKYKKFMAFDIANSYRKIALIDIYHRP